MEKIVVLSFVLAILTSAAAACGPRPELTVTATPISDPIRALKDQDPDTRKAAAQALQEIGPSAGQEAVSALILALQDKNSDVRGIATQALSNIGSQAKDAVPALIQILEKDEDARVRQAAALALGKVEPDAEEVFRALTQAIGEDESPDVRLAACIVLGNDKSEEALPIFIQALRDEDHYVRLSAIGALGRMGPDAHSAIPSLIEIFEDNDEAVRYTAALALEDITGQHLGQDAGRWQQWWREQK
jgi:HEAT repeat protein